MTKTIENWTEWLKNSRFSYMNEIQKEQTLRWLFQVRDKILDRACLKSGDTLIDIGTGTGLLAFKAYDFLKDSGKIIASDTSEDCITECKKVAKTCNIIEGMDFLLSDAANIKLEENSVDIVVMRSVLVHILDKISAIKEFYRILKPGGRISIFEPIIKSNTKYYQLINPINFSNYDKLKEVEYKIMTNENDPITNFDDKSLVNDFKLAGFKDIDLDLGTEESNYQVSAGMIEPWFNSPPSPGSLTLKEKFLKYLDIEEINDYINKLKSELDGKSITVKSFSAYISAKK
ncbi:MAG: methyltransferase domain-containing protein [bacterium]